MVMASDVAKNRKVKPHSQSLIQLVPQLQPETLLDRSVAIGTSIWGSVCNAHWMTSDLRG